MKALFVMNSCMIKHNGKYYSNGLPAEIWIQRYTKVFDKLVVCTRYHDSDNNEGVKLSSAKNVIFHCTKIGNRSIEMYTKIKKLEEHIEKEVKLVDCVIARMSIFGIIAVKYAKKYNKPYIFEVVGRTWDAYWNHSLKGKIQAPFLELLMKKIVREAPYVTYVTQKFLQKCYPTKGISAGISDVQLQQFDDSVYIERVKKINSYTNNKEMIIATVGGVNVRAKGQQFIIEALSKLGDQGNKYIYYIIGGGDQTYLKTVSKKFKVEKKIKFLGALSHEEVFEVLKEVDIYAQPSLQEGLPRALIEAMSRGIPAFGTRTAGIPELLDESVICRRKNVDDICNVLNKMDRKYMIKLAKQNYMKSKEFDCDILNKKWINFFMKFRDENIKNNSKIRTKRKDKKWKLVL